MFVLYRMSGFCSPNLTSGFAARWYATFTFFVASSVFSMSVRSILWNVKRGLFSSCFMFCSFPVLRLSIPIIFWFVLASFSARWLPMNPATPVIRIVIQAMMGFGI